MFESDSSISGKICLVTGATSGIGAATALSLAQLGATVIVGGRSRDRCRAGVEAIKRSTGNRNVEYLLADLTVQDNIYAMVQRFKQRYRGLDVLINNAGGRFLSRSLSADGYEMTFALNHMGPFILTNLLLEVLLTSTHGRIVNVASEAHRNCTGIDFTDLHGARRYLGKEAYARSKLANLLFTYELARQLDGTELTVNALHPGNVWSRFSRNNGWLSWARHIIGSLRSGELVGSGQGARMSVYLAASSEVEGISGKYFSGGCMVESSVPSYDSAAARRLWEISLQLSRLQTGDRVTGGSS
jgi:NAD(P)-dependent dehydrogenase (short-subunit alcohol dehydrogenase family)